MKIGSALWLRRQRAGPSPAAGIDCTKEAPILRLTASTSGARLCVAAEHCSPGGGETTSEQLSTRCEGAEPLVVHRRLAGSRRPPPPRIDCALAKLESSASDPFASAECRDIAERFDVYESLGQGSTAVVYRARPRGGKSEVALKVLRVLDEEMLCMARHEYELLSSIEHPHIIHALDFFTYSKGVVMVLDYFRGMSLEAAVLDAPAQQLEEDVAQRLFVPLMRAVEHLHGRGILHRDVKATNVLVNESLTDLKLVDFNTARRWLDGALTLTGTEDYMPPEVLLGEPHTTAGDIWASGLCLYFSLVGSLPLRRQSYRSKEAFARAMRVHAAARFQGARWERVDGAAKECLQSCLACDPDERPCAPDVLQGAWLCG